ncbi:MAG: hypothetical protein R3B41_00655 [Candidatus Doudnabacteria bacterium]
MMKKNSGGKNMEFLISGEILTGLHLVLVILYGVLGVFLLLGTEGTDQLSDRLIVSAIMMIGLVLLLGVTSGLSSFGAVAVLQMIDFPISLYLVEFIVFLLLLAMPKTTKELKHLLKIKRV